MRKGLSRLTISAAVIFSLFLIACGDGNSDNNPAKNNDNKDTTGKNSSSSYLTAKIGGGITNDFSSTLMEGHILEEEVSISGVNIFGTVSLDFPSGVTGTYNLDDINYTARFDLMDGSQHSSYLSVSGSITLSENDGKTAKGQFSFKAVNDDESGSITVSEGKFEYHF